MFNVEFLFFFVLFAGISLSTAQFFHKCWCKDLLSCSAQLRNADDQAQEACEKQCSAQIRLGNANQALKCLKDRRSAVNELETNEDKCVFSKASVCQDNSKDSSQRPYYYWGEKSYHASAEGGSSGEDSPALRKFIHCKIGCMEEKKFQFVDVESCATKHSQSDHKKYCMLGNHDVRQAKHECHEENSLKQKLKQQQCECLRAALGKSITEMPCGSSSDHSSGSGQNAKRG